MSTRRTTKRETEKEALHRAYRMRAGIVGRLLSCLCMYPIEKSSTSSEHAEWCPAQLMLEIDQKAQKEKTHGQENQIRTEEQQRSGADEGSKEGEAAKASR